MLIDGRISTDAPAATGRERYPPRGTNAPSRRSPTQGRAVAAQRAARPVPGGDGPLRQTPIPRSDRPAGAGDFGRTSTRARLAGTGTLPVATRRFLSGIGLLWDLHRAIACGALGLFRPRPGPSGRAQLSAG